MGEPRMAQGRGRLNPQVGTAKRAGAVSRYLPEFDIMSGLTYTTTCPLCPKTFHHGKVEDMLQNGVFNTEAMTLFQQHFARHLFEKHPEHWAREIMVRPGVMSTMLLLKTFAVTTQDDSIGAIVEWSRHQIHEFTGFHTPDEKLISQVAMLGLNADDCAKVLAAFKTLRDILEERPPFEPRRPGVYEPSAAETALVNGGRKT
jgi:hypothetical protein